nr:unnamed protein product [Spirometra erinaceieuropaei]
MTAVLDNTTASSLANKHSKGIRENEDDTNNVYIDCNKLLTLEDSDVYANTPATACITPSKGNKHPTTVKSALKAAANSESHEIHKSPSCGSNSDPQGKMHCSKRYLGPPNGPNSVQSHEVESGTKQKANHPGNVYQFGYSGHGLPPRSLDGRFAFAVTDSEDAFVKDSIDLGEARLINIRTGSFFGRIYEPHKPKSPDLKPRKYNADQGLRSSPGCQFEIPPGSTLEDYIYRNNAASPSSDKAAVQQTQPQRGNNQKPVNLAPPSVELDPVLALLEDDVDQLDRFRNQFRDEVVNSNEANLSLLRWAIISLPDENRIALQSLLYCLNGLANRSSVTQMGPNNLAICFTPTLFHLSKYPRRRRWGNNANGNDLRELDEQNAAQKCLCAMITNAPDLFMISEETLTKCHLDVDTTDIPALSRIISGGDLNSWLQGEVASFIKESAESKNRSGWTALSKEALKSYIDDSGAGEDLLGFEIAFKLPAKKPGVMGYGSYLRTWRCSLIISGVGVSEVFDRFWNHRY